MTNLTLASLANLTLYASMAVLALAMIAFAVHVAMATAVSGRTWHADGDDVAAADRILAGVGTASAGGQDRRSATPAVPAVPAVPAGPVGQDLNQPERPGGGRSAMAGSYGMSLSWLGTFLLVASVALRGASVSRPPLGNMFEFAAFGAMFVMLVFLGLAMKWPLRWLGLFVVTPVLLILGLAMSVWYTAASELLPSLKSVWLVIHVTVATLSVALFTLGCSVLILHLLRARQEAAAAAPPQDGPPATSSAPARSRWDGFLATLPSARALDRIAYGLNIMAFPLYTFTLIAGAIWAQQAWGSYWNWDPKETWTFVVWVIYAAYLHARATSGWSLRTANILALVGYAAIMVNFTVVNIYFPGQHSYSGLS